jgi:hypothetical protein
METQVPVGYYDKARLSTFFEWCSCSSDDAQVSLLTCNTLTAKYSAFFETPLFTLTAKKFIQLEKAKAYSLFSVSRIMILSHTTRYN